VKRSMNWETRQHHGDLYRRPNRSISNSIVREDLKALTRKKSEEQSSRRTRKNRKFLVAIVPTERVQKRGSLDRGVCMVSGVNTPNGGPDVYPAEEVKCSIPPILGGYRNTCSCVSKYCFPH
jgi:hypothetical protein